MCCSSKKAEATPSTVDALSRMPPNQIGVRGHESHDAWSTLERLHQGWLGLNRLVGTQATTNSKAAPDQTCSSVAAAATTSGAATSRTCSAEAAAATQPTGRMAGTAALPNASVAASAETTRAD